MNEKLPAQAPMPHVIVVPSAQPETSGPKNSHATFSGSWSWSVPASWGRYLLLGFILVAAIVALCLGIDPAALAAVMR